MGIAMTSFCRLWISEAIKHMTEDNSYLLRMSPTDRPRAKECLAIVEGSELFRTLATHGWVWDRIELQDAGDVLQYYSRGGTNREEWFTSLSDAMAGRRRLCVIEMRNRDRRGLEGYPEHVLGYVGTFFVDVEDMSIIYAMKDVYLS